MFFESSIASKPHTDHSTAHVSNHKSRFNSILYSQLFSIPCGYDMVTVCSFLEISPIPVKDSTVTTQLSLIT